MKTLIGITLSMVMAFAFSQTIYAAEISEKVDHNTFKIMTEGDRYNVGDEFNVLKRQWKEVGNNAEHGGTLITIQKQIAHGKVTKVIDSNSVLAELSHDIDLNHKLNIQKLN